MDGNQEAATTAIRVALAGNPNTGKTTLFNRLTGARARVANYPGVTVDKRMGWHTGPSKRWHVHDLPGCYSIDARSPDEAVAHHALSGRYGEPPFDVVVVLLDAAQLSRNLLVLLQIAELGRPVVGALNLVADAANKGIQVDHRALSSALGCPIVAIEAPSGEGFEALASAIETTATTPGAGAVKTTEWSPWLDDRIAELGADHPEVAEAELLWRAVAAEIETEHRDAMARAALKARFDRIDALIDACVTVGTSRDKSWTERIDDIALHPVAGIPLFVLALGVLFQAVFAWSEPAIDLIDGWGGALGRLLEGALPESMLRAVLIDGVLAGIVGTAVFLPQICVLFLGVELLEDSGYLARAAVVVDRVMRAAGLPGRAFVPLLSSFACNVPGVMAARTIPSYAERMTTIMIAPLMTCSARLPVYTMVTAAVFAGTAPLLGFLSVGGILITGMYFFGIAIALLAAVILRRTTFTGPGQPLLIELPPYRWPRPINVVRRVAERAWLFITHTGTVIVALTVVLWALMTFPQSGLDAAERQRLVAQAEASTAADSPTRAAAISRIDHLDERVQLERSYAGAIGKAVEPIIAPMGFDWRIGIGIVGSFAAREVLIPVMGQVYGRGDDDDDAASAEVGKSMVKLSGMTPLVGLSLMIFFAIAMQCLSTVAVIRHETQSWKWAAFSVVYLNVLAWLLSAGVFQVGTALGFS